MRPFRIERYQHVKFGFGDESNAPISAYMDRIVKLIPAEVLGVYLTISGFAKAGADPGVVSDPFLAWWPVVCLLLVIGSRIWGTQGETGSQSIQWVGVLVAAVSFLIWVYAMGDSVLGFTLPDDRIAPAAVAVWTFVVPWFYRGD